MSVERVLGKILQHNDPILGCILLHRGKVYDNLPERYELVDVLDVAECAESVFELAGTLDTGPRGFDQLFLEFEEYSFIARTIDDGVLVLLCSPVERSTFKKLQVGVNLFMKPLQRELTGSANVVDLDSRAEPMRAVVQEEEKKEVISLGRRMFRSLRS